MADTFIQLPPDGTGKQLRAFSGVVGGSTVHEQAFVICDANMNVVDVLAAAPAGTEHGLVVRNIPSGTQLVDGSAHTQPVSAAALPLPAGAAADGTDGTGIAQPTGGGGIRGWLSGIYKALTGTLTVDGSGHTQPVSAASLPLPTGAATSAKQPALGTAGTPSADVISVQGETSMTALKTDGSGVTQPVSQATAANLNATVTQQALTKGTQGSAGVSTQDLKDAGRTFVGFTIDRIAGVAVEALATFTNNKGGTVNSGTSYTVTAGKTLRIQAIVVTILDSTTTAVFGRLRLRAAASVLVSSPILAAFDIGNFPGTAAAGLGAGEELTIADGLEVAGGQQIGISQILSSTSSTLSVCVIGYEY